MRVRRFAQCALASHQDGFVLSGVSLLGGDVANCRMQVNRVVAVNELREPLHRIRF